MTGTSSLLAFLAPGLLLAQIAPLPPPPLPADGLRLGEPARGGTGRLISRPGSVIVINGRTQQAQWLWVGNEGQNPQELWLPLEVLQLQFGVNSRTGGGGLLELEWFGRTQRVPPGAQRSLEDEVAVNALALLEAGGVSVRRQGDKLFLERSGANLLQVRSGGGGQRVVLDLDGPTPLRSGESGLRIGVQARPDQLARLKTLGLEASSEGGELRLSLNGSPSIRVFTLGDPARVVLDLPAGGGGPAPGPQEETAQVLDPRLVALLDRELRWERRTLAGVRINAVQLDPRSSSLKLRPLIRDRGMEGLGALTQLAGRHGALVAVNGGYFNRVNRLPLGALRVDGRWLSGPILNRGVVAWDRGSMPRFGRLRLEEWAIGPDGQRLPITVLNSGYVQRGLSRYTADWGPLYRALSGGETGLRLRDGRVVERLDSPSLAAGVALAPGEELLVARGGATLPWSEGDSITVRSEPSEPLGLAPFVVGGGPLLLLDGRTVINGAAELFSPAFMSQGAPRTVVASDGNRFWLITLEGVSQSGPTLAEAAELLRQLGLRDALNLDGGSSTGLVMGGTMPVKGRGVAGAIHHGIGLVP
jgi:hypothetical protein